jgi:hypothetical protein
LFETENKGFLARLQGRAKSFDGLGAMPGLCFWSIDIAQLAGLLGVLAHVA